MVVCGARIQCSGALDTQRFAIVENACTNFCVYSRIPTPAAAAAAMMRSSTSVRFMTWLSLNPRNFEENAVQDVLKHKRAVVADVRVVVDRRPTGVHADFAGFLGDKRLGVAAQRVV